MKRDPNFVIDDKFSIFVISLRRSGNLLIFNILSFLHILWRRQTSFHKESTYQTAGHPCFDLALFMYIL